jgi:hypothetical protein
VLVCTVYSVLYGEIALSRKPFGIGHMYIQTFSLKMTHTKTSHNIDLSTENILCILNCITYRSRDSIGIATGYGLDNRGFRFRVPVGSRIFSSQRRPDRPWGPTGARASFPGSKAAGA